MAIGGNTYATLQIKDSSTKNSIGEHLQTWTDAMQIYGWLDYSAGESNHNNFGTKAEETTHIFLADYVDTEDIKSNESRLIVNDKIFEILLIDDPMGMHRQLEFYLRYVGDNYVDSI